MPLETQTVPGAHGIMIHVPSLHTAAFVPTQTIFDPSHGPFSFGHDKEYAGRDPGGGAGAAVVPVVP